jgi:SSS family transporter
MEAPHRLSDVDLVIVAFYLTGITLFGFRFRSKNRSLRNYFLANRVIPWWAIMLSIVAAETSTLTIVSIPGLAFVGNWEFLQLVLGYLLGRVVVCVIFLPRYFRGELFTAYELIGQRFGPRLHRLSAALFLALRAAAEGVRVFAVSIVIGAAVGTHDILSIAIICVLTLAYTLEGGLSAVIWTDVVQMFLYLGGVAVAVVVLGHSIAGGWGTVYSVGIAAGKLKLFDFAVNVTHTYTFWAGVVGGCFFTMASHGTDQLMVQRLLAARNLRESRIALLVSGVVVFVQFALFLSIGTGLYYFYNAAGMVNRSVSADRVFPLFMVQHLPVGISGLLIASVLAAAMSNLSAAVNSLSSTSMVDFYLRWRPQSDEQQRARSARVMTVFWTVVLFVLALISRTSGHVVEAGLSIASVAYGALLGVFLLGTLTKAANERGTLVGMVFGLAVELVLWRQPHAWSFSFHAFRIFVPKIAWTWLVLIGSLSTFVVGLIASYPLSTGQRDS